MNLKAWIGEKIEGALLSNIAKGIDAGKYGPRLQSIWRFGKGYATLSATIIAGLAYAASYFDNTGAATAVMDVSGVGAGLGLWRKGAHMEPPKIPVEYRDLFSAGLSIVTWLLMAAQGLVWVCGHAGASWVCNISGEAQFAVALMTALSSFLASWLGDPIPTATKEQV